MHRRSSGFSAIFKKIGCNFLLNLPHSQTEFGFIGIRLKVHNFISRAFYLEYLSKIANLLQKIHSQMSENANMRWLLSKNYCSEIKHMVETIENTEALINFS